MLRHTFACTRTAWSVLTLLCLSTNSALAQQSTAALSGHIVDPSGALVAEAAVTLTDVDHGISRETKTNSEGLFVFEQVVPSTYTARVMKAGFASTDMTGIVLNVGDRRSVEIALTLASRGDSITVEASSRSESPAVSTVVDRTLMENQPLNGRSFQRLIELSTGTTITASSLTTQGQFSVNGQRASSNYFMVDGVSANFASSPSTTLYETAGGSVPSFTASGTTASLASVDAVQEFSIQTSTYAPEFGRQPGGQVSIVTRSGTNTLHGTAFDYLRNSIFDANNFFANRNGLSKPAIRQNDFGGVFGGPLTIPKLYDGKDRTFFFASYEGVQLRQPFVTEPLQVPTIAARNAATGPLKDILNAFPLPTGADIPGAPGAAAYVASFSNPQTVNAGSIRVDQHVGSKLILFGRYNIAPSEDRQRARFCAALLEYETQTATGGATMLFSPSLSNDLRANWSQAKVKQSYYIDTFGGAIVPPSSSLYPDFTDGSKGYAYIEVNPSGSNIISDGLFSDNRQRQFNIVDTLSYTRGSHVWKFGVDYRRIVSSSYSGSYKRQFLPDSITDLVANNPVPAAIIAPQLTLHPQYNNFSAFAQDTWRVSQRLTLTYGLRYEINPAPNEANGNLPYTVYNLDDPTKLALAPQGTRLYSTTYKNFAPRVGFSYKLPQTNSTVIRGGFGMFYDLGYAFSGSAFSTGIFPFASTLNLTAITYTSPAFAVQPPPVNLNPPYSRVFAYSQGFEIPYTLQYNFTVEQGFGNHDTITVGYVGANGRRLGRVESLRNVNASFRRIDVVRDNATSDYNALQAQLRHRFSHGLQVLASYTFAKSLDTVSDESQNNFQVPAARISPSNDRGPSSFDVRNSFTGAVSYSIPTVPIRSSFVRAIFENYGLDATIRAFSGKPVNIVTGRDAFGLGITNVARPDLVTGLPIYLNDTNEPGGRRINPQAFDAATPLGLAVKEL